MRLQLPPQPKAVKSFIEYNHMENKMQQLQENEMNIIIDDVRLVDIFNELSYYSESHNMTSFPESKQGDDGYMMTGWL